MVLVSTLKPHQQQDLSAALKASPLQSSISPDKLQAKVLVDSVYLQLHSRVLSQTLLKSPHGSCRDQIQSIVKPIGETEGIKPSAIHLCSTLVSCPTSSDLKLHLWTLPPPSKFPTARSQRHDVRNTVWVCILNDRKAVPVPSCQRTLKEFYRQWESQFHKAIKGVSFNSYIHPQPLSSNSCYSLWVCNRHRECVCFVLENNRRKSLGCIENMQREELQWNGVNKTAIRLQNVLLPSIKQANLFQTGRWDGIWCSKQVLHKIKSQLPPHCWWLLIQWQSLTFLVLQLNHFNLPP